MFLRWARFRDFIKKRIIRVPPSLILVSSLAMTIFVSALTFVFQSQLKRTRIEHKIETIKHFIESNIQSQIDSLLRPTQGLFVSSQFVDHKEFASFENVLQISNQKSGIQAVSYIIRLPESELKNHTKTMNAAGFSDFVIWPEPTEKPGQDFFPITYIYPMDWRNRRAHGYNVGHEEKRRQAMDLARDTGEAAMTGQIKLVQEDNVDLQSGFIIFSPLYNNKLPVSTVEERRRALTGYISGAFRTQTFFNQLMQNLTANVQRFNLELYDGEIADPRLLFYSFSSSGVIEENLLNFKTTTIEVGKRKWLARITTTDARPVSLQSEVHWFLLIVGLLVSLLLYLVTKLNLIQNMKLNQDIEMLRETKLHLQQAKESAEAASTLKGAFLANMSHEIRTPLSVIISSSNFLMSPQIDPEEKEKFAQIISRNGKHLLNIINDILDLSKIEAGMVSLEFAQILIRSELKDLEEDMRLLAQAKNISFQMQISDELPEFIGTDPSRMQQILRNIIGNAIKFTERGSVEVIVDTVKNDEIRFLVKDSGIGLSNEQQKNIFAPFSQADVTFTRKYGGSGLGLVLSKKLASLLGGDVTLKSSQSGVGSVFEINLKNKTDSARPYKLSIERTPKNQFLLRGKKILLVEDSQDTQFVVTRILQLQGAEVTVAKNGAEGVDLALQQNFDLVLMDIQMPVMDGFAATKILREKGYTKPVFALTAHTQPQFKELSAEAGFDNYLSKPFQIDELLRKIRI